MYVRPQALIAYKRLGYRYRRPFGDYPADPLSVFMQKDVRGGPADPA